MRNILSVVVRNFECTRACARVCVRVRVRVRVRACFSLSQFGYVLTAVIRIRPPKATGEHHSWALIAYADIESVDRLIGSQTVAHVEGDGMTFTARRIDPKVAVSSDGSFHQIFQTCNDRVAQARAIALACADSKVTYHLRDRCVARSSAGSDEVSIGCAEASYECVGARCSLAPGASFVLVAAVSASATEAESTLATLQAAKDIENTVAPVAKTEKLSKITQQELTTQALKLTTGRLRRHLMQYSAQQPYLCSTGVLSLTRLCVCVSCCASIFCVEPPAYQP